MLNAFASIFYLFSLLSCIIVQLKSFRLVLIAGSLKRNELVYAICFALVASSKLSLFSENNNGFTNIPTTGFNVDSFGAFVVMSTGITHSRDDGPFRLLFHCVLCHEQGMDNVSASRLMHLGIQVCQDRLVIW